MHQTGLQRATYMLLGVVLLLVTSVGLAQAIRWNDGATSAVENIQELVLEDTSATSTSANALGAAPQQAVQGMDSQDAGVAYAMATSIVPILVYHGVRDTAPSESVDVRRFNVAPSVLDRQLAFILEQGFAPISFATLARHFDEGKPLPARPIIISFDDGTDTQYQNALPLLVKHGVTATFFIYPHALGYDHFMTWDELGEVAAAGMEIGSHSYTHQYMTRQDEDAWAAELADSKEMLMERLGVPVTAFAYPFGLYDERLEAAVREAGYTTARGLDRGVLQSDAVRYKLRSYLISNDFEDFAYILTVLAGEEDDS